MGCRPSREAPSSPRLRSRRSIHNNNKLDSIQDSVHVMLEHDKKLCARTGQAVSGYVPRKPHPLLVASSTTSTTTVPTNQQDQPSKEAPGKQHQRPKQQQRGAISAVEEEEEEAEEHEEEQGESSTVDLSQNESDEERARRERKKRQQRHQAASNEQQLERLCWHAAHHSTVVDPRDVQLTGCKSRRIPTRAIVADDP